MLRSTISRISLGPGLALQLWAVSVSWPLAVQAQQAVPVPANAAPAVANPGSHDSAIIQLREIAYGKDEDGNFKEPSLRVREAAKEALKQEVMLQVQEEEAAKAGPHSPAINGSNLAAATAFDQAAPAGTNSGDAVPGNSGQPLPFACRRRPTTTGPCASFLTGKARIAC